MSRSLSQIGSDCLSVVKVIRYEILGGLAADLVSTALDFPAPLLRDLWGSVVRGHQKEQVVGVLSHADIQRFKNDPHRARVVLVYSVDVPTINATAQSLNKLHSHREPQVSEMGTIAGPLVENDVAAIDLPQRVWATLPPNTSDAILLLLQPWIQHLFDAAGEYSGSSGDPA